MLDDRTENHARFVWCAGDAGARNAFALLRRTFRLDATPDAAELHLFVDARYRLEVNGVIAAYGPCRFLPAHPQFDTIDLRPFLRPGDNTLLLTCWAPNSSTYQTAPDSAAGCIAWGGVAGHDLATPGAWEARPGAAWDPAAPAFSFAQGPVEIRDLTAAEGPWSAPVVRSGPWGSLAPREIPPLSLRLRRFARLPLVAALDDGEERRSIRRLVPAFQKRGATKLRFPYAVELRSPRAQQVPCGLFWGPHHLNGRELAMANDPVLGNRQNTMLDLAAGGNLLYGEPEVLAEVWAQYIALPRSAGVEIGAIRHGEAMPEAALAAARGAVPASVADLDRLPFAWSTSAGAVPARDLAWDRPGRTIATDAPATFP